MFVPTGGTTQVIVAGILIVRMEDQVPLISLDDSFLTFNAFSTGTHFFVSSFWVWLDDFIDISEGVWRSED